LAEHGIPEPLLDAELLLAYVLQTTRSQLLAWLPEACPASAKESFWPLLERRCRREPLAYILGHWEFYGLDLVVDSRVFIPRPETELLVEKALEMARLLDDGDREAKVADVGTGSGAIAIALATHLPRAQVYATDTSADALTVAAENCRRHRVTERVILLQGDGLTPIPCPVDLILANLPYVAEAEWETLQPEIKFYEPRSALIAGPDGLEAIRRLLAQAPAHLLPGGAMLLEIGSSQGEAVQSLAREHFPRATIQLALDYADLDRLVIIKT